MVRATITDDLYRWFRTRAIHIGISVQDQTGEAMRAYALANGYTEGENDGAA